MRRSRKPLSGVSRILGSNPSLSAIKKIMNKIKIIIVYLFIPLFVLLSLVFMKVRANEQFKQKVVLNQEIRKVLGVLMLDLRQARENSILDVPADGAWHNRIDFDRDGQGTVAYFIKDGRLFRASKNIESLLGEDIGELRIRRQKTTPFIVEVQIEAKKKVAVMSYLKIRTR